MHIHNQAMGGPDALSEAALFQRAQSGCPDSLNALMARHDGLVQAVVRRQVLGDLPFAEALQAGRIGLWRAILGYDPKRGMMFGGRHMRGLAQETAKPTETGKTLRRLLTYFRPFHVLLLAVAALILASTALRLVAPYLIGVAVDQFIAPSDQPGPAWLARLLPQDISRSTGLTATMLLLLGSYLLNWVATAAQFYLMTVAGQRVLLHMRTQIFELIQTLSLKFFDQHEAGDLMSRLVNDTQVINQVFSGGVVRLASMSLSIVGIIFSMLGLNWRLALVSFTVLPVMFLTTTVFSRRARAAFRRTRQTIGQVSAELQENIAAVREVQAFTREDANVAEFEAINAANRDANVQAQSVLSAFSPALDVLSTIALAIVAGYGGYLALNFDPPLVSVGVIVSFLIYVCAIWMRPSFWQDGAIKPCPQFDRSGKVWYDYRCRTQ